MRIGGLCEGYGGLSMAAQAVLGGRMAWVSEIDPNASRILAHHWPDVPNLGDLTAVDWTRVEPVDVLTAGYPCQPFSHAGKRKGSADVRHLWPHIIRAVRHLRPRLVLLENVAGHLTLGFGDVLADLAEAGFDAEWVVLRAADVGAPHGRARLFIAATDTRGETGAQRPGLREGEPHGIGWGRPDDHGGETAADAASHAGGLCDGERNPAADAEGDGRDEGRPEPARLVGGPDAAQRGDSTAADAAFQRRGAARGYDGVRAEGLVPGSVAWGAYGPAIERWQHVLGRPAPRPVQPSPRGGRDQLSPRFVEWLMGLPDGHVTDVPGLTRNAQLKALGNGVVPAQAAAAFRVLLPALIREANDIAQPSPRTTTALLPTPNAGDARQRTQTLAQHYQREAEKKAANPNLGGLHLTLAVVAQSIGASPRSDDGDTASDDQPPEQLRLA